MDILIGWKRRKGEQRRINRKTIQKDNEWKRKMRKNDKCFPTIL